MTRIDVTTFGDAKRRYIEVDDGMDLTSDRHGYVWTCAYCGSIHPMNRYECPNCGAPRKA